MKWLTIIAVLLTIAQAPLPVLWQATQDPAHAGNQIESQGKYQESQSDIFVSLVDLVTAPEGQDIADNSSPNDKIRSVKITEPVVVSVKTGWRDNVVLIFSGLLVFVGGIAGWLAWKTVNATSDAAKAALDSVKAVINAEPAWIVINVESPAPNTFHFKAVNVGKTPARVISIHGRWIPVNRRDQLQLPAESEMNISLISTPPCFLPPTVSCNAFQCNVTDVHGDISAEEWMNHLRLGLFEVFFYGKIRYYDVLNSDHKVLHETKWLYRLPSIESALPIPDPRRPEHNVYS